MSDVEEVEFCTSCGEWDGCSYTCPRVGRLAMLEFSRIAPNLQKALLFYLMGDILGPDKTQVIIDRNYGGR